MSDDAPEQVGDRPEQVFTTEQRTGPSYPFILNTQVRASAYWRRISETRASVAGLLEDLASLLELAEAHVKLCDEVRQEIVGGSTEDGLQRWNGRFKKLTDSLARWQQAYVLQCARSWASVGTLSNRAESASTALAERTFQIAPRVGAQNLGWSGRGKAHSYAPFHRGFPQPRFEIPGVDK